MNNEKVINQMVHFLISNKMDNPSATRLAKAILSADFMCLIKYGRTITKQDSTYTLSFSEIQSAINNYQKEDSNYDELAEVDREELLLVMNRFDIDNFHDIPLKFNIELSAQQADNKTQTEILPIALGCPCIGCESGSIENCRQCVAEHSAILKESKEEQRKNYIEKHGIGCETCDRNPVNHGRRATRRFDTGPRYADYTEGDIICNEETGYPEYKVATSIYSIDIPYCC